MEEENKNSKFIDFLINPKNYSKRQSVYIRKCINSLKQDSSLIINEDNKEITEEKKLELLIEMIKEWRVDLSIEDTISNEEEKVCELCGRPIKYRFPIKNMLNGCVKFSGCNCITGFDMEGINKEEKTISSSEVKKLMNDELKKRKVKGEEDMKFTRSMETKRTNSNESLDNMKEREMKKLTFFINERLNVDISYNKQINEFYNIIDSGNNNIDETKNAIQNFHMKNSKNSIIFNCFAFCYKSSMYGDMTYFDGKHLARFLDKVQKDKNDIINTIYTIRNFTINKPFSIPDKYVEKYNDNYNINNYMIDDLQSLKLSELTYIIPALNREITINFSNKTKEGIIKRIELLNDNNIKKLYEYKLIGCGKGKSMDEILGINEDNNSEEDKIDEDFVSFSDIMNYD